MGLFFSAMGIERLDDSARWRRLCRLWLFGTKLGRLDETGPARRPDDAAIRRKEFAESRHALVSQRLQQLWPCRRLLLAGSVVWRRQDNGARRISDDLSD